MKHLYDIILHQPLLNTLVFFYNTIAFKDLGLAIIFLTAGIRLLLWPVFAKSARHQVIMQRIQPKIQKAQEDHKHNKERQMKEVMAVYKEHKVNPFSGFLFLIIQLPILIALYQIFLKDLTPEAFSKNLYSFVAAPERFNTTLFGLIPLDAPNMIMVGLAALAQYFQGKLALPKLEHGKVLTKSEKMGRQMVYLGPILTFVIFYRFPAAVALYWLTTSVVSIIQQIIVNRSLDHGTDPHIREAHR